MCDWKKLQQQIVTGGNIVCTMKRCPPQSCPMKANYDFWSVLITTNNEVYKVSCKRMKQGPRTEGIWSGSRDL